MGGHVRAVQGRPQAAQLNDLSFLPVLRAALRSVDYTVEGVAGLLGERAHRALARNETTPARREVPGHSELGALARLWLLAAPVAAEEVERALPSLVEPMCSAGILQRSAGEVRALLDVRPYADDHHDFWVVSDLTPGLDGAAVRMEDDYVLGVSAAATSLAQLTVRDPVQRALDLGTGSGVQSLHLRQHAEQVVATDVNARALRLAEMTARLNDTDLELRRGSLFEPVTGERFDLVVTNPPFVISAGTGRLLAYRDSGLPADEVVRRLVAQAPRHLRPGGLCQILANWAHVRGEPWQQRLTGWLREGGCDAWVVQRETVDPAEYVELWLKDAGLHGTKAYVDRYARWLAWFDEQGIEGVGFGWINLRMPGSGPAREPVLRMEDWPHAVEQPLGAEVAAWAGRVDQLSAMDDERLLHARLAARADVRQETLGRPGEEQPEVVLLRQQRGLRRVREADPVVAGLVGASDGELSVGQILDALATLLGQEPSALRAAYLQEVRVLLAEGFLVPLSGEPHPREQSWSTG